MHMQGKLLENRNKMLKAQGINETLFMALITLESQENHSIQPSELSCALGSSRTNATRIADELEKRGWIERRESDNDRRCLHLQLTDKGHQFLREVLPPQHNCLHQLWSSLSTAEKTSWSTSPVNCLAASTKWKKTARWRDPCAKHGAAQYFELQGTRSGQQIFCWPFW